MCFRKICYICKKVTYGGCGKHLDLVFEGVPEEDRCQGHPIEEEDTDEDGQA